MKKSLPTLIAVLIIIGTAIFLLTRKASFPVATKKTDVESSHSGNGVRSQAIKANPQADKTADAKSTADSKVSEEMEEDFNQAMQELPTLQDIKNLDEHDTHMTPELVQEGGAVIGWLLQKAEVEPQRREETLKFLVKCAEQDDLAPAVRAVCWSKVLKNISSWNVFIPIAEAKVPPSIQSLAMKLR